MITRIQMTLGTLVAVFGISALGTVYAANARLDEAVPFLIKAKGLVAAASPSDARPDYARHVRLAETFIDQAMHEIALAKRAEAVPSPRARPGAAPSLNPSGLIQLNPQPEPPLPARGN